MGMNDKPKHRTDRANSLNGAGSNRGLPNIDKFWKPPKTTCANCKKLVDDPNPHIKDDGSYTCQHRRVI